MKGFKLFLTFSLTLFICVNALCACEGDPVSPAPESDSAVTTENAPATNGITEDATGEKPKFPEGTKTFMLYAFEGTANAELTVKDGKYTEAAIKTVDGSVIANFTVEYAEAGADCYARFECIFDANSSPLPEIAKLILKVNDRGDYFSEAYYAADGSLIVEFTLDNEYGENGEIIKNVFYQGDTKMMEMEYAASPSGEPYPKLMTQYFEGGHSIAELDENGHTLRYHTYENGVLVSRQENTYDESGRPIGVVSYDGDKIKTRWEYSYERDRTYNTIEVFLEDRVLLEKHVNGVQCYTVQYRLDGSKIKESLYKEDPNKTKTVNGKETPYFYLDTQIEYDEAGKKTQETFYYYKDFQAEDGSVVSKELYHIRYKYDESGQTVHEFKYENVYDPKGVIVLVNQYNNGELTFLQVFGADGRMQFANRYSGKEVQEQEIYEYDANGKRQVKEKRYDNFLEIPKVD